MLIKYSRDLHKRHCVVSKSDLFIQNKLCFSHKSRESQIKGNKALLNENLTTGPVSQELNLGHDGTTWILLPFSAFGADYRGVFEFRHSNTS